MFPYRDCQTAEDVRAAARAMIEKRRVREAELRARAAPAIEAPRVSAEEMVTQLVAATEQAIEVLREIARPRPPSRITQIQFAVGAVYRIRRNELVAMRRDRVAVQARFVSMLLCKMLTESSISKIGRMHGDRDHTTVLHAIRTLAWLQTKLAADALPDDQIDAWATRAALYHPPVRVRVNHAEMSGSLPLA